MQQRSDVAQGFRSGGFKIDLYRVKYFWFSPLDLQTFALSKSILIPTESCILKWYEYKYTVFWQQVTKIAEQASKQLNIDLGIVNYETGEAARYIYPNYLDEVLSKKPNMS